MPRCPLVLVLALLAGGAAATTITPPNTSLATIPVAYFGGTTAPRPPANYRMLSRMRIVMVEKWEGACWADCLKNSTATPPLPCSSSCEVERDMLETLTKVKALNPAVSTVMYWNTLLAFPFYEAIGRMRASDALLMDANTKQPVMLRNDNGMPGIGVPDFGQAVGRQLWQAAVKGWVSTGKVDGIFGDKWNVYATPNASNTTSGKAHGWAVCNHWCGGITQDQALAFNEGKRFVLNDTAAFLGEPPCTNPSWDTSDTLTSRSALCSLCSSLCAPSSLCCAGPEAVFFSATDDLVKHNRNPSEMIASVQRQLATTKYAWVYGARDQQPDHDPANTTSACPPRMVALFLLAVEEGAFLGCQGWTEDFARPLGKPLSAATTVGAKMSRRFASGTWVEWDLEANTGVVHWANRAAAA